jgi:NADH-quinone oxidoreductase subunit J
MTEVSLPVFAAFAIVALLSAVMVITRKNPVHSAIYLLVTLFSVACIYVLLRAEFLAAVQVLVYAGGIMVLFLFVIFLVRPDKPGTRSWRRGPHVAIAFFMAALLVGTLVWQLVAGGPGITGETALAVGAEEGNLEWVSMTLFRYYLLPFETVSILLMVALVGAVVIARPGD